MSTDSNTLESDSRSFNRRDVLIALSASATAGLAGCGGNGSSSEDDDASDGSGGNTEDGTGQDGGDALGERVPTFTTVYWGEYGDTTETMRLASGVFQEDLQKLGVETEIEAPAALEVVELTVNDTRELNFAFYGMGPNLTRLDPTELGGRRFAADWAGADGNNNNANYANCDQTDAAILQARAPSEEERRELVMESQEIMARDRVAIPYNTQLAMGAVNTNQIDIQRTGNLGLSQFNVMPLLYSEPLDDNSITLNVIPDQTELPNHMIRTNMNMVWNWGHIIHSTLKTYNEDTELINLLADDITFTNNGRSIEIELKDASFTNGDPVTADDVKFTFEQLPRGSDNYPLAFDVPYSDEGIQVVDEKTVTFSLEEPYHPLSTVEFTRWPILHEGYWTEEVGIIDDPTNQPDPMEMPTCGPFEVSEWEPGRLLVVEPSGVHPVYSPSHSIEFVAFSGAEATIQSFFAGELDLVRRITMSSIDRIENDMQEAETIVNHLSFGVSVIFPQHSFAPTKFLEFRDAAGTVLNRRVIDDLLNQGRGNPESTLAPLFIQEGHPFRLPEDRQHRFTDEIAGDPEAARQKLEDAGWGWDEDGRLHYPPDADLSPLWPEGETPSPEYGFPCLTSEGEWLPPEER